MSDKQKFVSPPEEEIDHPTRLEISEAPNKRSKPKRAPSSTANNNDSKKKPASQQPRQPAQNKQEIGGKPVTAESKVEEVSKPAAKTKQEKEQAQQELQESVSEPVLPTDSQRTEQVTLPVSTEPIIDTPPVEPELQTLPTNIEAVAIPVEAEQEALSPDVDLDDTHPRMKVVSPPPVEAEPEVSPQELELYQTSPRIKAVTTPLVEPELALAEQESASSELESTLTEPELVVSSDTTVAVLTEAPSEAVSSEQVTSPEITGAPIPTPLPAIPQRSERRRVPGKALAWVLLIVLTGSSFLLWRDVNDTHLYLYALDPASGQTVVQQDLGGEYQGDTTITNPVQVTSSLMFGVQTGQSASGSKQQLFSLTGNATSWKVESQFSAPLEHETLALTPDKRVVVVHADGLQVMTTDGQMLWHMQGDEPTLGTHPFQPAFFGSTLFAVKSASNGVVASYDLQSGAVLWTQKLDDTLEYAAPFLLYDNMLYIAADHTLYALDRADGTLLWKAERPTRTLLMFTEGQPLLLVAGSQGLAAMNAFTGAIAWSYNGQPLNTQASTNETLMPAQFYQASIASTNNVMYATGIVWDAQQVREQLWLFAVDAATGNVRWSERIGSDFTSADAGRIYPPSVDTTHRLVILQQAQNDGKHIIAAYNTGDGTKRWSVQLDGVTASAPGLLQVSNTALILLNMQSSRAAALHNWSPMRMLLIALAGLSVLWLLLLWMLPFHLWIQRLRITLHNLQRYLMYPLKLTLRLWRHSHTVFALVLLAISVLGGALLYGQLASPRNYLNHVATSSGSMQWQLSTNTPVQLAMADPQGSIVIRSAGTFMHQLTSFSSDGASQWTSFASEGGFSLPTVSTQPGTVLVALSGRTSPQYRFASDDPAYAHPLDSLYTLYLLDRQTGQIIWQNVIISPEGQQNTTVLGADAKFFYVASRATNSLPPGIGPIVQLVAVDKTSGNIVWRIFGPREPDMVPMDYGSLLLRGRSIIWQVSNTIYKLDTTLGQIQWRKYIAENLPQASLHEEAQVAEAAGVLLVARSDAYHALDLATGNERWVIANPGNDTAQIPRGVVAVNNIFLLYGGGTLQAVDPVDQHTIWSQKQLEDIQSLKISDDGTLIYAILVNLQSGSPTTQVLAALDVKTGEVRWTFQPFEQERFVNAQSDGFQYSNSTLYATVCLPANQTSCDHEILYAITAATGEKKWKFEANNIYNVHVSAGGDIVAFQTNNSVWGNLIEHFKG